MNALGFGLLGIGFRLFDFFVQRSFFTTNRISSQYSVLSTQYLKNILYPSLLLIFLLAACAPAADSTPIALGLPARILGFWTPESGSLNVGEQQPWFFGAAAGDSIRVRVLSPAAVTLVLDAPDGTRVAEGADELEALLTSDGIYTVTVALAETTQYEIGLSYTDRPNPADYTPTPLPATVAVPTPTPLYYEQLGTVISGIRSGETLEGAFTQRDERHVYTFEGEAGQYINAQAVRVSGGVDPVLTLFAPSGAALATDDNSGGVQAARLRSVRLPGSATYTLQIFGQGVGSYQINLLTTSEVIPITPTFVVQSTLTPLPAISMPTLASVISGDPLGDHLPAIGVIERPGDFDRYPFQAAAGDLLTISVRLPDGSGLNPLLEIFDPLGALIATTTGKDALIGALRVSETGTYQVFVAGENDTTGTYIVAYGNGFSSEETLRGLIAPDQTYNGDITRKGLRETWNLDLNAGDVISAAVGSQDLNLDPVLELVAPDGSIVAMDDNSGGDLDSLIASAHAPISGRYALRVTASNALGDGAYNLVWRVINLAPTATTPPGTAPIMVFDDRVTEERYQFYPFYGEAGTTVGIQVIAAPGSQLDPVAVLIAPDGTPLAEGDDSEGDLNPRFAAELPDDGTYMVRVNGYLSSGDFTLTVQQLFEAPSLP